jgi:hypothetical protein
MGNLGKQAIILIPTASPLTKRGSSKGILGYLKHTHQLLTLLWQNHHESIHSRKWVLGAGFVIIVDMK